jgi:hypothetical protein
MKKLNPKPRISKRDLESTKEAINRLGFHGALDFALGGIRAATASKPDHDFATTMMAWSGNLLADARKASSEEASKRLYELAHFYRILAHRAYWFQRKHGKIDKFKEFLQLA